MEELNIDYIYYILNLIMKKSFCYITLLLVILEILFLLVWLIGIFIKSEKMIKKGIKMSIIVLLLLVLVIGVVIIISIFKSWEVI